MRRVMVSNLPSSARVLRLLVAQNHAADNNATNHARELEAKAQQFSIKQFGRALSLWALRIGALLAVFAFFGSHM